LVYADNAGRISTKEHTQNNHTNKQHLDYYLSPKSLNKSESVRFPEGRPLCIMMIGLPYSGKSYIREELLEEKKYAVISLDDELEKEAINRDSSYNDIFADSNFVKAKYGELNNKLAKAVYGKENIIIDMTNLSRKSRKKRLDILTNDYYRKALLVLETTDNIHSRMNTRKEKTIPLKVIDDMTLSFNMPTHNEFDDITLMMSD
jgi:predicted kinase